MSTASIRLRTLRCAVKKNGIKQLFFYLSNLDTIRFIEYPKVVEFLRDIGTAETVLDLGSGYSILPEVLQPNSTTQYICLDLSPGACKYQANAIKNINPLRANMCYLPFASGSIPVVLAVSSIEHVPDDLSVFKEIRRVLTKGGTAVISLDYSAGEVKIARPIRPRLLMTMLHSFKNFWRVVIGQRQLDYFMEQTSVDTIIKHYNDKELARCLTENGLEIIESYYYNKTLLQHFHRILPFGWFILKDITLGLLVSKLDDAFVKKIKRSAIIIIKVKAI